MRATRGRVAPDQLGSCVVCICIHFLNTAPSDMVHPTTWCIHPPHSASNVLPRRSQRRARADGRGRQPQASPHSGGADACTPAARRCLLWALFWRARQSNHPARAICSACCDVGHSHTVQRYAPRRGAGRMLQQAVTYVALLL